MHKLKNIESIAKPGVHVHSLDRRYTYHNSPLGGVPLGHKFSGDVHRGHMP